MELTKRKDGKGKRDLKSYKTVPFSLALYPIYS